MRPRYRNSIIPGATIITDLVQIVYASQPFGYDPSILSGILLDARRLNARDDVTGALVCRADIYLQLLEGPESAVRAAFDRIERDDRHLDVRTLASGPVTHRLFGDWAMLHDPADSWIWSQADLDAGHLDTVTPGEAVGLFDALAARVRAGITD